MVLHHHMHYHMLRRELVGIYGLQLVRLPHMLCHHPAFNSHVLCLQVRKEDKVGKIRGYGFHTA